MHFIGLDDPIHGGGVQVAFLRQQGLQGAHPQVHFAQGAVRVVMIMGLARGVLGRMSVSGWHACLLADLRRTDGLAPAVFEGLALCGPGF